jgi:DNA-binding CsgD family transcriptional regulator
VPSREPAPATLEQVYEAMSHGREQQIDELLARFSSSLRLRHPFAIALRAMKSILGGDVPAGVALLRRAIEHSDSVARQYLIDMLVPQLVSAMDIPGAEEAIEIAGEPAGELAPLFLASRAVIAARSGRDVESRRLGNDAAALARAGDNPLMTARVLQRCSSAAFYREDYAESSERSLEAARAFERLDSHRSAATSYSILFVLASEWSGDPDIARVWAERITMSGVLANDRSLQTYGLVAQFGIAAESGDSRRLGSIRARLLAGRIHEQYAERFSLSYSEALLTAWGGAFGSARATILGLLEGDRRSLPEVAFCEALLALFSAAEGDVESARELAHRALGKTVHQEPHEPLFDTRRRRVARVLAASACIIIGEASRGRRALSRNFDPDGFFGRADFTVGLDEDLAPSMMRGYVRLLNVVAATVARTRPQIHLTPAEAAVLRALPEGKTLKDIAAELHKSHKTIERQVGSIYGKLDVSNRAQAIQKARELGF